MSGNLVKEKSRRMDQHKKEAIIIYRDNQSTIAMITNSVFYSRTRHLETRHHFIRLVENRSIKMSNCSNNEQLADVFTKPLSLENFLKFRDTLRVVRFLR